MNPKKFQLMLHKLFFISIFIFMISQYGFSCTISNFNVKSQACLGEEVNFTAIGSKTAACSNSFTQGFTVTGPAGGFEEVAKENDADVTYVFSIPGTYTVTFTISDDPSCPIGCTKSQPGTIEILANPVASFVLDEINVCRGSPTIISLNIDQNNVKARVVSSSSTNTVNGFDFIETEALTMDQTFYLQDVETIEFNCGDGEVQDSLKIIIKDVPSSALDTSSCNDQGTFSIEEHILSGGEPPYTLVSGPGSIQGNRLITDNLMQGVPVAFTIDAGAACGEFPLMTTPECPCASDPGTMQAEPIFLCNDGVAMPTYNADGMQPGAEQLFFILHETELDTLAFDSNPIAVNRINSTFGFDAELGMKLNTEYFISAAVGVFQEGKPLLRARCFKMSEGTRVTWLPDNDFSVIGDTEACQNSTNVAFLGEIQGSLIDGTTPEWFVNGNAELTSSVDTDGPKAFVSFKNASEGEQITVILQTSVKIAAIEDECLERDSIVVTISGDVALDTSRIIRWPGKIFASTEDPEGVCYQWGYFDKAEGKDFIYEGETSKFYYDTSFVGKALTQVLWLATYKSTTGQCSFENAGCITYNYYNALKPPGLNINDQDDFEFKIVPNPSNGVIGIDLKGSFKGNYNVSVINNIGTLVSAEKIYKEYERSSNRYDLSHLPAGLYYVILTNELGERNTIKTIIAR